MSEQDKHDKQARNICPCVGGRWIDPCRPPHHNPACGHLHRGSVAAALRESANDTHAQLVACDKKWQRIVDQQAMEIDRLQNRLGALNLCDPNALDKAYREIERLKADNQFLDEAIDGAIKDRDYFDALASEMREKYERQCRGSKSKLEEVQHLRQQLAAWQSDLVAWFERCQELEAQIAEVRNELKNKQGQLDEEDRRSIRFESELAVLEVDIPETERDAEKRGMEKAWEIANGWSGDAARAIRAAIAKSDSEGLK